MGKTLAGRAPQKMAVLSEAAWDQFLAEWKRLQDTYSDLRQRQDEVRKLESTCSSSSAKHKKTMDSILSILAKQEKTAETLEKVDIVKKMKQRSSEMRENLPKNQPLLLRGMVGRINLTLSDVNEKQLYKDRYENFKLNMTIVFMILSLISIIFINYRLPLALLNITSTWYYSAIIMREHILKMNGSRIRPWWTAHHYFSAIIAIVFLIWPRGPCMEAFILQFLCFFFYLSFVMLLQFLYQKGLMYRLVALGQAHPMEVTGEGVRGRTYSGLFFLIPFLVVVYIFQVANSGRLFYLYFFSPEGLCPGWQLPVLAVLFLTVAVGNMVSLGATVYYKMHPKPHLS